MTNLKSLLLLTVFCFLFSAASLYADMYSWTDENGVRHFSNEPPPENITVEDLNTEEEIETTSRPSSETMETDSSERSLKDNAGEDTDKDVIVKKRSKSNRNRSKHKVVMFTTPNCGWCKRAKAFFQKHDVQYVAYDIQKSKEARMRFKKLKGRGVPLILIGNKKISGFNKKAISNALGLN